VFSQLTNSTPVLTKQDYLLKSKQQKSTAKILLIGGITSSLIMPFAWIFTQKNDNGLNVFSTIFIVGLIAIPASIPLFIAAHQNKKKAMSLSLKNEKMQQLNKNGPVYKAVPSLSLTIQL
ncbi:MAG: hypothetical protein ACHQEB_02415, partial [Chitinophagales bacterium]